MFRRMKGFKATLLFAALVAVSVASGLTAQAGPLVASQTPPPGGRGPQPPPPTLLSPADGSSVSPIPTFTWSNGGGGVSYVLELAPTPVSLKSDGSFVKPLIRTPKLFVTAY